MRGIGTHLPDGWRPLVDPAWLAGWEPRSFELPGGTTQVVAMGEGPPLVLVPPLPGFKEAFLGVAHLLARDFRVVTFDLRERFDGRPSWEALVDDLDRVTQAFAPGRPALLGHSLGGALAQHWALAHPERARALILSSSFPHVSRAPRHWFKRYLEQPIVLASQRFLPRASARAWAERFARRGAWVYDERCDERVRDFVGFGIRVLPYRVAFQCVGLAVAHDTRARVSRLQCPVLLVVGEREARWAREATDELARLIPGAQVRISPEAAHLHLLSRPEWLAGTVEQWLGSARESGAT
jgi:pimeloyl-ACP methyl ester carboxylesterase